MVDKGILILVVACVGVCLSPASPVSVHAAESLDVGLDILSRQMNGAMTEQRGQKIAVADFSDLNGNTTEFGRFVSEELTTRLFRTARFQVVERRTLQRILEEQKLQTSGIVDEKTARKIGAILGIEALCTGTVTDLARSVKINARIMSVETGAIFTAASVEIWKDEAARRLLGDTTGTTLESNSKGPRLITDRGPRGIYEEAGPYRHGYAEERERQRLQSYYLWMDREQRRGSNDARYDFYR